METKEHFDHHLVVDRVNVCISEAHDDMSVSVYGWCNDHHKWKKGDRILFEHDGGQGRYKVKSIRRPGDPADMYFMECSYFPRTPHE